MLNASPDLRHQILRTPALHPETSAASGTVRHSPIAAAFVTNADVDHIGGLINLREGQPFALYGSQRVLDVLDANPVFEVLNRATVPRRSVPLEGTVSLCDARGQALGLSVEVFPVPGKVALYLEAAESESDPNFGTQEGDTVGLRLVDEISGASAFYIPNCAAMNESLARRVEGAELVFFDGTLYRDDEMINQGLSHKTGKRMGHISVSGGDGAIAAFEALDVRRKVFIHINNSNPILLSDSEERAVVEAAGWDVAWDGMEIVL